MTHAAVLRIIIVDDHAAVREGLKRLISDQHDMDVVAEAGDGQTGLRLVQEHQPDVVLMDVSMPGWSGVVTTKAVREGCPEAKVLALSRHQEREMVRTMLDAGAAGYVLKRSSSVELIEAIRAVADGRQRLDPAFTRPSGDEAVSAAAPEEGSPEPSLTPDEEQVLQLVAAAHSNDEVSRRLGMSPADAAAVKRRAMEKARLASRVQLVAFARRRGWIE